MFGLLKTKKRKAEEAIDNAIKESVGFFCIVLETLEPLWSVKDIDNPVTRDGFWLDPFILGFLRGLTETHLSFFLRDIKQLDNSISTYASHAVLQNLIQIAEASSSITERCLLKQTKLLQERNGERKNDDFIMGTKRSIRLVAFLYDEYDASNDEDFRKVESEYEGNEYLLKFLNETGLTEEKKAAASYLSLYVTEVILDRFS